MNKLALFFVAASSLVTCVGAHAADGTVNFSGQVMGQTCRIDGSTAASTKTVTLDKVSTSSLAAVGQVAGRTKFTFTLDQCSKDANVTARFEPGPTVNASTGNLINQTPGGSNAEIQILNSDYGVVNVSTNSGNKTAAIVSGNATLTYYAQYVAAAAPATAGVVTSSVQYSLVYN
ncbi:MULTISPECIES: fimbrial protein [unclassified Pseudomonas]|uniref:fimbrial protein n=1 Tax=unclassified Pseudomonas TaxID=196821 RepID=UPI000BD19379|nr:MULTISPECIES: fimbrial protein [unclassified Pseudomonas]PVZ12622.1 major type 1 subunit fimbrin (pilin) [Pseudomonas sp. URIL14HWK12:I12]PVZ23227.1 major type 1 subunit fimbrin (pilin) [Pseudomonas sp. URIL14HWK12:I10]PVZ32556.1 major type 1 subunit fimbrin (pilin) [Pseudomonas sp. URIL14HWK12:I11]SNZ13660.1 major type 1 subunit fimbrin (pilin) [Pseudomonas sp. URIL14HWK12:I9]